MAEVFIGIPWRPESGGLKHAWLRMSALAAAFAALTLLAAPPAGSQPATPEGAGETITAAIAEFWPPHFIVRPGEAPTGFAVEIIEAVAARAGYSVSYRVSPTVKEAFDIAVAGEVDVIPSVGVIEERRKLLSFTDPVETFAVGLFVREDTQDIQGVGDLAGRRVAVVTRNVGVRLMRDQPGVESVMFDDVRSALFDLTSGRVDAMVYPVPILQNLASEVGVDNRIKTVGKPLLEVKRAIGVHPSRTEIHQRLSAAVADFTGTAEYQEIYLRWFGRPEFFWTVQRVLTAAAGILLTVIIGFSLWHYRTVVRLNRALEGRVEKRTTELRSAQAELLRKQRLAGLGELIGTVAHELRNPLGTVVLSFAVIEEKLREKDIDLAKNLDRISRNIDRCTGIIDDLLEYAQVRAAVRRNEDIDRLIRETVAEYAAPDGISLVVRPGLGDRKVAVDREQIRRIILNFLDNACQAVEQRYLGKSAADGANKAEVVVETRPANDGIEIVVSDNGEGIPANHIDQVMEPLFSTKPFGVGLGLPNAQNIVSGHGGRMDIHSEPGLGTEIVVALPASAEEPARRPSA